MNTKIQLIITLDYVVSEHLTLFSFGREL